jgi:hypothetical protein
LNTDNPSQSLAAAEGGQTVCTDVAAILGPDRSTVDDLRRAVRFLADRPAKVVSWLTELGENADTVRQLAGRSYWHPNGFAKLVLHVNRSPEFRIRLHVWPVVGGSSPLSESNPHSHRWDFASTVLVGGGLHVVEYVETEYVGKQFDRYRFGAVKVDPAALLGDGTGRLKRIATLHVYNGQTYECDSHIIHTVAPIKAGVMATLVVQGPHRSSSTVVYRVPGCGADQPNRPLPGSDFRWLISEVVVGLQRNPA